MMVNKKIAIQAYDWMWSVYFFLYEMQNYESTDCNSNVWQEKNFMFNKGNNTFLKATFLFLWQMKNGMV